MHPITQIKRVKPVSSWRALDTSYKIDGHK